MTDVILNAIQSTISNYTRMATSASVSTPSIATAAGTVVISQSPAIELTEERIKKLPTVKSVELIKQESEAEIHKQFTEQQRVLQEAAEQRIASAKTALESYVGNSPTLSIILKLPIVDPKFLASITYNKLKNTIREDKQKATKKNIKDSVKKFKYPMAPTLPTIPQIPDVPRLSNITVPTISLSNL